MNRGHLVSKKTAQKRPKYNGRNNIVRWIKKLHREAANMCQIYTKAIMISDISKTQGTAIPLVQLLGHWRIKSKLAWPEMPLPPPKALGEYRRLIMKSFGQGNRIHNLGAEIKLNMKLG